MIFVEYPKLGEDGFRSDGSSRDLERSLDWGAGEDGASDSEMEIYYRKFIISLFR